jgi:NAD(P)-dependent dehydrogenase (short-subunit alcohol dehydrogenase family)
MTALVFGGRSPIGLALCRQLAESGSTVHLATRTVDDAIGEAARSAGVAQLHAVDLSDTDAAVELTRSLHTTDNSLTQLAFVHRFRGAGDNDLLQYTVEVLTPYAVIKSLADDRDESGMHTPELAVLLTTSPAARVVVGDQGFQYHASKAAISQLVRYAAAQFAPLGLRVNGLCPGSFVFKDRAAAHYAQHPEIMAHAASVTPAGRMGTVDEIAAVGAFLLGALSSYVFGQVIEVDGGVSLRDPATGPRA